jgi:tetraacyldisaccharide-1-P 4'-kinase
MRSVHLLAGLVFVASPLLAQTGSARNAVPAVITAALTPATRDVVLPEGTEFSVVTMDDISSKTANKDDIVAMKIDEAVTVGNQVAIPKGAFVRASVADVKRAGHLGHAGTLSLKVESTSAVDGQKIPLRASKSASGDSHLGATVALTVLFGPLGLLKHGNDVNYPAGTKVTVYTDQQTTIKVTQ